MKDVNLGNGSDVPTQLNMEVFIYFEVLYKKSFVDTYLLAC